MADPQTGREDHNENYLTLLDDLIVREYRKILNQADTSAKLGEFLKMIELRHKMTPVGADQKEFWTQMNQIREQVLQSETLGPRKKPSRAKSTRKRGKNAAA